MKPKKILLVYPPLNRETKLGNQQSLISGQKVEIEISFAYLASFLRQHIPDIEIEYIDFRIEKVENAREIFRNYIEEEGFTHVGFSCYSTHYTETIKLASIIKEIDGSCITIVGGFHPTVLPDDFFFNKSPFDYVIQGEGELVLLHLMNRGKKKHQGPVILKNRILDLNDTLPVTLELFEKYRNKIDFSNISVYFSRGCINDCSFCISREHTCGMKKYRMLSPLNIKRQLQVLENYRPACITIADPLFGSNLNWFTKVTSLLGERETNCHVKVEMHVDMVNDNRVERFKENKIDLTVGFESASTDILFLMNKTRNPVQYIENMEHILKLISNSNINLILNILLGHPGERRDTIKETFDFLETMAPLMGNVFPKFSIFRLYPGTPVFIYQKFYLDFFKTKVYYPCWWYLEKDHSISPSLVDPSKDLTFIHEIEFITDMTTELIKKLINSTASISIPRRLALLDYGSRITRTHSSLKEKVSQMIIEAQSKQTHQSIHQIVAGITR